MRNQYGDYELVIRIVCITYLNRDGNGYRVGGVQSYVRALAFLMIENGHTPIVYQMSDFKFKREVEKIQVIGVGKQKKSDGATLVNYIEKICHPNYKTDILLFSTELLNTKHHFRRSIAIQHGIGWDYASFNIKQSKIVNITTLIKRFHLIFSMWCRYKYCDTLVCVDYNFVNWYRTFFLSVDFKIVVIPNYSEYVPEFIKEEKDRINIVFSRRFVKVRGVREFVVAVNNIQNKYKNVFVSIAGEGEEESWIYDNLQFEGRVNITKYDYSSTLEFHKQFDIAVVPSEASEGTSLSLLEAMSAGCCVVSTYVGGLSNIIIDGFNGVLVEPENISELEKAIEFLICNPEKRKQMAVCGKKTVDSSFSINNWKRKWLKVLNED